MYIQSDFKKKIKKLNKAEKQICMNVIIALSVTKNKMLH